MSTEGSFGEVVQQILEGQAPRQVRSAAARGALPLPRTELVRLFVALRTDEDEEIRREAESSLADLDGTAVREVLGDEGCAPEVLSHFAKQAVRDEALAERITFHAAAPPKALAALAAGGSASVIDLVLTNQERLLVQPDLLNLLSINPALRADQRGRILELLERVSRAAEARERNEGDATEEQEEFPEELQEAARLLEIDIGELYAASEILDGEEFENSEDPEIRGAYARILTLNAAQKAVLAMRGGREERLILIRDTNKMVALGVLKNPRITDDDVESFSRMRNLSDEVLRQIGQNREWSKSYAIVLNLVNNPRTPQGISMNFVPRLQNQDLKRLVASRDVPELIRRMGKRTLDVRTSRQGFGRKR